MTSTIVLTRDDLEERRQQLLDRLGVSLSELTARANAYALTEDERAVWEALKGIEYLLADA